MKDGSIEILAHIASSESYIRDGEYEEAIKLLRWMISENPNLAGAIHNLRFALHEQGTATTKTRCGNIDCMTLNEVDVYPTDAVGAQFVIANYAFRFAEIPDTVRHIVCPECNESTMYTFTLCARCIKGYVSSCYVDVPHDDGTGKVTKMEKLWECPECRYKSTHADFKTDDELRLYLELLRFRLEIMAYVERLGWRVR
jgi:rubredoxin